MKIRQCTPDILSKAIALLRQAFPRSTEAVLVENLHANNKEILDWVCIERNKVVAYIAFSKAFNGTSVCGFHLAPLAVKPQNQRQGVGSELLRFALRQNELKESPIYVLGSPDFYQKFGFTPCPLPLCPFTKNNKNFLSLNDVSPSQQFTIGYESEFKGR